MRTVAGVVAGARRRQLVEQLSAATSEIRLCAPPGYGKSVLAQLLRARGIAVPLHEERCLRTRRRRSRSIVVDPEQLSFDEEELAQLFAPVKAPPQTLARIHELTEGWPVGALYFLRLTHLGTLERALGDLTDASFEDLFEYVEENVYVPATRSQRLRLLLDAALDRALCPVMSAALRARHSRDIETVCLHRARSAERRLRHSGMLAHDAAGTETRELIARLPFERLQEHPQAWLCACDMRLDRLGPLAFASEAAAVAKAIDNTAPGTVRDEVAWWLALAYELTGNTAAAAATIERSALAERVRGAGNPLLLALLGVAPRDASVARAHAHLHLTNETLARRARMSPELTIQLFHGGVLIGEREIALTQRELAVLFTLAAARGASVESHRLAAELWPELNANQGRAALKVAVSRLRARLQTAQLVRSVRGGYELGDGARVDMADLAQALDVCAADGDTRRLDPFAAVLGASRPPRLRDAEWFAPIEVRLVDLAHRLGQRLAQHAISRGDARAVRKIGHALLGADSCDEAGCALVVRSYVMEEDADGARREFDSFARRLQHELGCAPSATFDAMAGAGGA